MRKTTALKYAVAGTALAALSIAGASAFADTETEDPAPTAVVNKDGHEVDEHAAHGQARAAEARAQRLEKAAEPAADDADEPTAEEPTTEEPTADEPDTDEPAGPPAGHTDNGNHGGPDEHAGDQPNENAFTHPAPHEPQGPKRGNGPNEHAGDHPNEHASIGSGNGQGHK